MQGALTPTKGTDEIVGTGLAPVREMVAHAHRMDRNEPSARSLGAIPIWTRDYTLPVSAFSDLFVGVNGARRSPYVGR